MALLKPDAKTVFLCGPCIDSSQSGGYLVGYPGFDGICDWCGVLAQNLVSDQVNEPQVGRYGYFEWSACLDLEVYRPFVWDVNLYYRDLGVPTDATRAQIKRRYQEVDGQSDDRLTYIVKVLLDPERRAVYDAIQPGDFYFDKYLRSVVVDRVLADSSEWVEPTDEDWAEHERTLQEDLDRRMHRPVSDEALDRDSLSQENALNQATWGYYTWRCRASEGAQNLMAQWRCNLALAMRERGVTHTLKVGIARGLDAPWAILPIGHRPVAFLGDGESPTLGLARAAVGFLSQPQRNG